METTDIQRHIEKAIDCAMKDQPERARTWATIAQAEAMLAFAGQLEALTQKGDGAVPALRVTGHMMVWKGQE